MADIYVLLTKTNTVVSRIIRLFSHSEYGHASISMDSDCREMYSFARKYTRFPLPAGFIRENVETGVLRKQKDAAFALYRVSVSEEMYQRLEARFADMLEHNDYYYDVIGLALFPFPIRLRRKKRYFCSQFVAEILQEIGALEWERLPSSYKPDDFMREGNLKLCCSGVIEQLQNRRLCG